MDVSLRDRPWTTQLAAVAVLAAIALFGFWKYYVLEARAHMARRETRLADLGSERTKAAATAARARDLQITVAALEQRFEASRIGPGDRTGATDFIRDVEAVAAGSNVNLRRVTPQAPKAGPMITEVLYKVHVVGAYRNLVGFFQGLETLGPAVAIRDVTISATTQLQHDAPLTAECVLSTFRERDRHVAPVAAIAVEPPPDVDGEDGEDGRGPRDPFVSRLRDASSLRVPVKRPAGLRGVLVDEVALMGILKDATGFLALLRGSDTRTFIVRSGEELLDGSVQIVTADGVTLSRSGVDPVLPGTTREVVKRLRPDPRGR